MNTRETDASLAWTRWKLVKPTVRFSYRSLRETLDGGQSFRWNSADCRTWEGIWSRNLVRVRLDQQGRLQWSSPEALAVGMDERVADYFVADMDPEKIADTLPWRSDDVLRKALEQWKGLRILRQPLDETLMTFLCSSNKRIIHIKQICEALARNLGEPLVGPHRSLPKWSTIRNSGEASIRACKTGYRAPYLMGTSERLVSDRGYLDDLKSAPYPSALRALTALPGVGTKVAECVLLFGAARMESFPVDTWIAKAMARLYGLHDWKPQQIAAFGRAHFGPYAGLAQQYLFAMERNRKSSN